MKNTRYTNTLERADNLDQLHKRSDTDPQPDNQIDTITKLEFLLSKYNFILNEYQLKYGSELFSELESTLNFHSDVANANYNNELRKILIENISLIKEYEKQILEGTKSTNFYKNEFNRIQLEAEQIVSENEQLLSELAKTKEEHMKLYKEHMNNEYSSPNEMNEVFKAQNDKLLNAMEQTKYELENIKNIHFDLVNKYEALRTEDDKLQNDHQRLMKDYDQISQTNSYAEKKMKENNNILLQCERRLNKELTANEKLLNENKLFKEELNNYREIYEDLERRKNSEVEMLMRDNTEMKNMLSMTRTKLQLAEDDNSNFKFDNNKMKQEVEILKFDCDKLTKILEDSNFAIKSAEDKENHIDDIIKNYKRKIDEAVLDKEKLRVKLTMVENNQNKMQNDYTRILQEKNNEHQSTKISMKEKYEQILQNREEEIEQLKNDLLTCKIERDKYFTEYQILLKENEKLSQTFREENDKYIRKYEDSERNSNRLQTHLQEKINSLVKKIEKEEQDKKRNQFDGLGMKEKIEGVESKNESLGKEKDAMERELLKLKDQHELQRKEKEYLEKELQRERKTSETRLRQLKEQCDLRVGIMENSLKFTKDQFESAENKAYEMLKKQENITDKFKDEFYNTVNYYENIISNLVGDQKKKVEYEKEYDNYMRESYEKEIDRQMEYPPEKI